MGDIERGVRAKLDQLGRKEPASELDFLAIVLARALDNSELAPKDLASLSREFRLTMEMVEAQTPPERDRVSELIDKQ